MLHNGAVSHSAFTALVIADSFTDDLKPLTLELPRCLMPVSGVPLLDYSVANLIDNGADEIYIVSCARSEQVQQHVEERWGKAEVKVEVIVAAGCHCVADALRHADNSDVLKTDFLLCFGDMLTNASNLKALWEKHTRKREVDQAILMTLFLKEETDQSLAARNQVLRQRIARDARKKIEAVPSDDYLDSSRLQEEGAGEEEKAKAAEEASTKADKNLLGVLGEERVAAVIDPTSSNLFQYLPWDMQRDSNGSDDDDSADEPAQLGLSLELMAETPTLSIRNDLIETGMGVCSIQLLKMFEQQGFDYNDVRDCVRSVINDGLLGNKIMAEILPSSVFLRRVRTLEQYQMASKAVLEGWSYPYGVDAPFAMRYQEQLSYRQPAVYVDESATLSHTARIGASTLISPKVTVGDRTKVEQSVIGRGVAVGNDACVTRSHVWEGATIKEGAVLDGALVCRDAVVGRNCRLHPGSMVSFGVVLAEGTEVLPGVRITRVKEPEMDDFGEPLEATGLEFIESSEEEVVGAGGVGRAYCAAPGVPLDAVGLSLPQDDAVDSCASVFCDDVSSSDSEAPITHEQRHEEEVIDTIKRAVKEDLKIGDVEFEVKSVRWQYDVSLLDSCRAVLHAFLQIAEQTPGSSPVKVFAKTIKKWKVLLLKVLESFKKTSEKVVVERELLNIVTDRAKASKPIMNDVNLFIHYMYDQDVLSESAILVWEEEMRCKKAAGSLDDADALILSSCDELLDMLKEDSEEEESDEDESD
eukprot:Rhum_TRINITY_DN10306_c0_g2::Rhum_TRINITY_DN10306_c0_g2_i1::g.37911::m.37911/K03240/EIF2B5; translation initiation factor eIF-2B subunit epsilon